MLCLKRNFLLVLPWTNQLISEFAGSGSGVTGSKLFCRCVAAIMRTCTDCEESAAFQYAEATSSPTVPGWPLWFVVSPAATITVLYPKIEFTSVARLGSSYLPEGSFSEYACQRPSSFTVSV